MALGAPAEQILRWVEELRGVSLEISGDDLLAAGVPEGPALGRALDETLRRKLDGHRVGARRGARDRPPARPGAGLVNADRVELPGARVLFSTRQGGVSEGPTSRSTSAS